MLFLVGCQEQIDPRDIQPDWPLSDSTLIGTKWSGGGLVGGVTTILYFESAERVIVTDEELSGEFVREREYYFVEGRLNGFVRTLGHFTVTAEFDAIVFPTWRRFQCRADFVRIN